jgi:DNA-binding transcriptional regulator GbsR (MarR family)
VDIEALSRELFGRCDSLALFFAIASLPKESFSTGELVALTGVHRPTVSKELGRLCSLGFVKLIGRRGNFERCSSSFWAFVQELEEEWEA